MKARTPRGARSLAAQSHFAHDRQVAAREQARLVYSSSAGRVCPVCYLLLKKGFGVKG